MKERQNIIRLLSGLSLALFCMAGSTFCLAQATDISQVELLKRIRSKHEPLILDVRSPMEYAQGHIPGAVNIPYDRLGSRLAEISAHKNKDIVLYCGSGVRVVTAANILQTAGFNKVLHLAGDMDGWRNSSLMVKR